MKLNRTNVLVSGIGSIIAAVLLGAGPRSTNIAMELSIFSIKCAFALLLLYTCMEKEQ
jgi:hypothetical protein